MAEHFAFLIEESRDGFPNFDESPQLWRGVIDDLIREKFACRQDPDELIAKFNEIEEMLDNKCDELGIDEDDIEYFEKREGMLTPEQQLLCKRADDCETCSSVRDYLGIMPYEGKWIPLLPVCDGTWDLEEPGRKLGFTWAAAMTYCWQLLGWSSPPEFQSLSQLIEMDEGLALKQKILAGLKIRPESEKMNPEATAFVLSQEPKQKEIEPELWQPPGEICCFIPPFYAGIDRLMSEKTMSCWSCHDIRIDPTRPLGEHAAILFLNLRD